MGILSTATGSGFAALGAYGASQGYQAKANASLSNIESALNLRATQATIFEQQDREISERLGQQLTGEDLETLKAESRLNAAQAETGTSGGTSDLAVAEAYVVGARNREVVIQSAEDQKISLARKNVMNRLDSQNRVAKYQSDIPTSQEISFGIFSQTMNSAQSGLSFGSNIEGSISQNNKTNRLKKDNELLAQYNQQQVAYQSTNYRDSNNNYIGF